VTLVLAVLNEEEGYTHTHIHTNIGREGGGGGEEGEDKDRHTHTHTQSVRQVVDSMLEHGEAVLNKMEALKEHKTCE
jgi:hypothetical protein